MHRAACSPLLDEPVRASRSPTNEQALLGYISVGTDDLKKTKRFDDAVLDALGYGDGSLRTTGDYAYRSDPDYCINRNRRELYSRGRPLMERTET